MALVAVINGVLRETVLIPRIGAYPGHVLSTAVLVVVILGITAVYFRRVSVEYRRLELLVIGALWMGLTVGFEFLVGYVENTPVAVTLGQYDVLAGQVWIAVPVTLLVSPLVFGWYLRR
jgi:predicted ABC-type sugar transport system permease subunit